MKKKKATKKIAKKKGAKKISRKSSQKSSLKPTRAKTPKPIGKVTHFYNEIGVAIVKFNKKVPVGVALYFRGATTDFTDTPKSMQHDHKPIAAALKGKQVGIKVKKRVREGDAVYHAAQ